MNAQPFFPILGPGPWHAVVDGDASGRALFHRHYSRRIYADGRRPKLYVGPGFKIVLLTENADALFVWRKEKLRADGQEGINCAIFRNESAILSSTLVRAADAIADARWPGERHFTFVDPTKIKSSNPGFCFIVAGWRPCGITKKNRLRILERVAA